MRPASVVTATVLALALVPVALPAQEPTPAAPPRADSTPAAATLHGQALAERQAVGGRFAGGFVSGLFLGLIGTGIAWAIAGSDDTPLPTAEASQLTRVNPDYHLFFQQGYSTKLKARRKSSALTGGLVGTATFVTIYLVATSNN